MHVSFLNAPNKPLCTLRTLSFPVYNGRMQPINPPKYPVRRQVIAAVDFAAHLLVTVITVAVLPIVAKDFIQPEWRDGATLSGRQTATFYLGWSGVAWIGFRQVAQSLDRFTATLKPPKKSNSTGRFVYNALSIGILVGAASVWNTSILWRSANLGQQLLVALGVGAVAVLALFVWRWWKERS